MCKPTEKDTTKETGEDSSRSSSSKVFVNEKWVLNRRPQGHFSSEKDCRLEKEEIREDGLGDDEILVKISYIGIDAFIRTMLTETKNGENNRVHGGIQLGDVIPASAIGKVVASGKNKQKQYPQGKMVTGLMGGQTFCRTKGDDLMSAMKLPGVPQQKMLSLFSISGITAFVGVTSVLKAPRKGETVVVTAAAGSTGSIAAQLAKLRGSRVIGVAGGPEKCRFLTQDLGLDGAIDYKDKTKLLKEQFDEQCPNGVDFMYDNVGGECLDQALDHLARNGRVVLCGAISQYGKDEPVGPSNYIRLAEQSATMAGFVVLHYPFSMIRGFFTLFWLFLRGKISSQEQVHMGIEHFPNALEGLFHGGNVGKPVIQLVEEQ